MKTLYLDLVGGISGDMFLGALIDLGVSQDVLCQELAKLNVPGWHLHAEKVLRNAISGIQVTVHQEDHEEHHHHHEHTHEHHHRHSHEHRGLSEITAIIEQSTLSEWVKGHAKSMFRRVATAEGKIHGKSPEEVHFHEVGAIDSIVDMIGACIGLELLGKPVVQASNPTDGVGYIECAHGKIPVPVPATLSILGSRGIALGQCNEPTEMITPTGATILAEFAARIGPMQDVVAEKIGYSFGSKEFTTRPNMLRAVLGNGVAQTEFANADLDEDQVEILQANIDDTTPEILGYVMDKAFSLGALDVWQTPILMKKNRTAVEFSILCSKDKLELLAQLLLIETNTIGVRHYPMSRIKLKREIATMETKWGSIPVKVSKMGDRIVHIKPEFDACKRIANEQDIPIQEVIDAVRK